jgi:hypothetical protein
MQFVSLSYNSMRYYLYFCFLNKEMNITVTSIMVSLLLFTGGNFFCHRNRGIVIWGFGESVPNKDIWT